MSSPTNDRPWTNREKNYLLTEIIKNANLSYTHLVDFINSHGIAPHTLVDVPLPRNRAYGAAFAAYRQMMDQTPTQPIPATPTPMSAPGIKRPYGDLPLGPPGARPIAPKPSPMLTPFPAATGNEPPQKRKRGRPPKHEAERKARADAASAGSPIVAESSAAAAARYRPSLPSLMPGPSPPPPLITAHIQSLPPAAEERRPSNVPTTRMEISAVLTPSGPPRESHQRGGSSSSSSGRRRRARSTRSDPDPSVQLGSSAVRSSTYDSPYARPPEPSMLDVLDDTPARAAVSRHRDAPGSATRTAPTSAPPESSASPAPPPAPPRPGLS